MFPLVDFTYRRKENLYPGFTDDTVPDRGEVTVTKTAVYADIISLQKALVPTYIFLPLWLAVLFSLVRSGSVEKQLIFLPA